MYIYKIENLVNHKVYIGLTTRDIHKRWWEHVNEAYSTKKSKDFALHSAIRKYGEKNFIIDIIDTAETIEELKQKEIYYIGLYHSYTLDPQCNGYNMTMGGDLNIHLKGEKSSTSKNTDSQRYEIIHLHKTTNMYMKDIAVAVGLNSEDGEKLVSMINNGEIFYQPNEHYPLRNRSMTRRGSQNPAASDEKVIKEIIHLLETTDYSQNHIAKMCNVHYNTVNNINTCKSWTHLHHYKKNIRQERK